MYVFWVYFLFLLLFSLYLSFIARTINLIYAIFFFLSSVHQLFAQFIVNEIHEKERIPSEIGI